MPKTARKRSCHGKVERGEEGKWKGVITSTVWNHQYRIKNPRSWYLFRLQNLQERVSESRDALSQLEANTEMIKVRAASEREEALKVFQGSITELKCSISAKTAEYNTVEASLKKTMQENADKETMLVLLTPLSYATIDYKDSDWSRKVCNSMCVARVLANVPDLSLKDLGGTIWSARGNATACQRAMRRSAGAVCECQVSSPAALTWLIRNDCKPLSVIWSWESQDEWCPGFWRSALGYRKWTPTGDSCVTASSWNTSRCGKRIKNSQSGVGWKGPGVSLIIVLIIAN